MLPELAPAERHPAMGETDVGERWLRWGSAGGSVEAVSPKSTDPGRFTCDRNPERNTRLTSWALAAAGGEPSYGAARRSLKSFTSRTVDRRRTNQQQG